MAIISSVRAGSIGSPVASRVFSTGTGGAPGWNQIVNAHIAAAAAIDVSKLAAGAANSILVGGGTPAWTTTPTIGGNVTVGGLTSAAGITATTSVSAASLAISGAATVGGSLIATGLIRGANIYPSNQSTGFLSTPFASQDVPPGGVAQIGSTARNGFVIAIDQSTGYVGLFSVGAGANVIKLMSSNTTEFGVSPAMDNKIHGLYSAGFYYLYNGWASNHFLTTHFIGL